MVLTAEISFCLTFGLLVLPEINFWKRKLLPHLDERLRIRHLDPLDGRKTMSLAMEVLQTIPRAVYTGGQAGHLPNQ